MYSMKASRTRSLVAFVVSAVLVVAAVALYVNRRFVTDALTTLTYSPSASIATIASNVKLTDKGRFIFYATRPEVEQQATFNQECPRQEAGSPILGCYTNDDRIYVYDLTNEQLSGMEEVTAVHEMLHAAWRRMGDTEKAVLTTELQAAYSKINDDDLKNRMEYYQRTEPGELNNELHSILGTEVASLGEPLESYYSHYFDRQTVLTFHTKYSELYTSLYKQADELHTKMQALAVSIESRSSIYKNTVQQYSADVSVFNEKADTGGFSSQSQFNSQRAALVSRSVSLNKERQAINADIELYGTYYDAYQAIAKQVELLNESIDSFSQIDQAPSL